MCIRDRLCRQLIRHALAGGLVGVEFKVAEGLFLYVKADDGAVGLLLVLQFEQRSQKAVNRVGGQSLVVGQLPDVYKRQAVQDGTIPESQIHASAVRVIDWKMQLGLISYDA